MNAFGFEVETCGDICRGAVELWRRAKEGTLNQPSTFPPATDKLQGPFPLPGGGAGYILPLPPTPAAAATPIAPQSLAAPAAPSTAGPDVGRSFSGAGINSLTDGLPPDVAADISSLQNVEFVNGAAPGASTNGGLFVYDKLGALQKPFTTPSDFWCLTNGVNGSPLTGCVNNAETLKLTDPQIGFDPALGLWIATEMAQNPDKTANVYVAVSTSIDATMAWNKWSEPVCTNDPNHPEPDQPLLAWSNAVVGIDTTCFDKSLTFVGADNLILIANSTLTSPASNLPAPIPAPCSEMAPARDEGNSFSNLYLVASIVPTNPNLANCAPSSSNTEPYVVEYTATAGGVFGSGGCAAGSSGCSPVSVSPQWGSPGLYPLLPFAQQDIAQPDQTVCAMNNGIACQIRLGDARITAAQIRVSSVSGTNSPILTTGSRALR